MRKYFALFTFFVFFFSAKMTDAHSTRPVEFVHTNTQSNLSLSYSFTLSFSGIEEVYNDHVGNEWYAYAIINDTRIEEGQQIQLTMQPGQSFTLVSYLQETNEKHIDHSSARVQVGYEDLVELKGKGFSVSVTIEEGNGRYSGNKAEMRFVYYVD